MATLIDPKTSNRNCVAPIRFDAAELAELSGHAALNDEWSKMFPDAASRPARRTLALGSGSAALVTCDVTAVIG
ncbi:MAG: hypothetical protein Q8M19_24695 [Reyranella sp.]|nr:hypothetical protein [Reyranella sp.]